MTERSTITADNVFILGEHVATCAHCGAIEVCPPAELALAFVLPRYAEARHVQALSELGEAVDGRPLSLCERAAAQGLADRIGYPDSHRFLLPRYYYVARRWLDPAGWVRRSHVRSDDDDQPDDYRYYCPKVKCVAAATASCPI